MTPAATAAAETVAAARDYRILAAPRVDAATFARELTLALSPAAEEATPIYEAVVSYGVDPALFLAQFAHESGYGRVGSAYWNRNTGNLRESTLGAAVGARPGVGGRFVAYPTWTDGARDHAALLASSLYGRATDYVAIGNGQKAIPDTARTMPYRWAPTADGNDPAAYGADLVARIGALAALGGSPDMPVPIHAGGLELSSSYAIDLPDGTPLFGADGAQIETVHSPDGRPVAVGYFGIPAGSHWYYVLVTTGAPALYPDGKERPTLLLVNPDVAQPYAKAAPAPAAPEPGPRPIPEAITPAPTPAPARAPAPSPATVASDALVALAAHIRALPL